VDAIAKSRPRVLIVDDDVDSVQSTVLLFDLQGFDTDMAFDGPHALDRARAAFPDLVLLDLAMPKMTASRLCRRCARFDQTLCLTWWP
jgi:CheY-like chemotaxis protein